MVAEDEQDHTHNVVVTLEVAERRVLAQNLNDESGQLLLSFSKSIVTFA